ncbi:HAMP domain-containing protein [Aquihabitans sp. G128]|uniref:sensor histidine kinase n=1 Tax=Aquihabitans sp. G128 TaxID=2849779 RepID=UPI001C24EB75|nr:ATP-binding protein [Aquihabitans sp. G128]QXC60469.1 HAMP domain-containing protein [Aquihabitans sp. G128]
MSPAAAAQLAFGAEFATFLVAVAGVASALRPGLLSDTPWARSALASGFLGLAVAAFLRGALIVPDPGRPVLQVLRFTAGLALVAGLLRWRGRRSGVAFGAGIIGLAAAGIALRTHHVEVGDGLRALSAAFLAAALVSAARRSISARIAVSAAVLVLGVVLVVAVSVSITVSDNVEGEALRRYTARAEAEADNVLAEARTGLGPARLIAGVLAAQRSAALQRVAEAGAPADVDRKDLGAALGDLTDRRLLDIGDPVVLLAPDGSSTAATPTDLAAATRFSLAGDPAVREALSAGAERQGVAVIGREAFAVAVAPLVVRPEGAPQKTVGAVVVARRLDDTYLRVLGTGGEDLSFVLATPTRVVARAGGGPGAAEIGALARRVVDDGANPQERRSEGFVAAAPIEGGDGRSVLAMVVAAPADAAEHTQEALFRTLFVVALGAAMAAVVTAVFVGERIGRGLGRLTEAAQQLQSGSLDTRIRIRSDDELGVLGEAFSSMASSIRVMTDELRAVAADEAAVRARLQAVVAGMSEALVAVDRAGSVIEVNRAGEELLGLDRADAVGRPVADTVAWRLLDGTAAPMDRADLLDGVAMVADLAVGADTIPVVVTSGTLRGEDGSDEGAVLVLRDVRSEREVEDLKSSILANIGHELRTPLTPIKGYAGMLRDRKLDEDRTKAFASEIISGVDQLERVVRQLVTFATIAAGHLTVDPTEADVDDLADGLRTRWAPRVGTGHTLAVDVADGVGAAWVDRALFDQAVDELVDNALKYSPDGGPVAVRFAPADGDGIDEPAHALTVTITDRGIGIPPERLATLADPFSQADPSNTRLFNGLGLGLACADRIVRAHGGRLAYASNERRGTSVSILLPLEPAAGEP